METADDGPHLHQRSSPRMAPNSVSVASSNANAASSGSAMGSGSSASPQPSTSASALEGNSTTTRPGKRKLSHSLACPSNVAGPSGRIHATSGACPPIEDHMPGSDISEGRLSYCQSSRELARADMSENLPRRPGMGPRDDEAVLAGTRAESASYGLAPVHDKRSTSPAAAPSTSEQQAPAPHLGRCIGRAESICCIEPLDGSNYREPRSSEEVCLHRLQGCEGAVASRNDASRDAQSARHLIPPHVEQVDLNISHGGAERASSPSVRLETPTTPQEKADHEGHAAGSSSLGTPDFAQYFRQSPHSAAAPFHSGSPSFSGSVPFTTLVTSPTASSSPGGSIAHPASQPLALARAQSGDAFELDRDGDDQRISARRSIRHDSDRSKWSLNQSSEASGSRPSVRQRRKPMVQARHLRPSESGLPHPTFSGLVQHRLSAIGRAEVAALRRSSMGDEVDRSPTSAARPSADVPPLHRAAEHAFCLQPVPPSKRRKFANAGGLDGRVQSPPPLVQPGASHPLGQAGHTLCDRGVPPVPKVPEQYRKSGRLQSTPSDAHAATFEADLQPMKQAATGTVSQGHGLSAAESLAGSFPAVPSASKATHPAYGATLTPVYSEENKGAVPQNAARSSACQSSAQSFQRPSSRAAPPAKGDAPPPAHHAPTRRRPRLRRTHSLPNLKARPVVDFGAPVSHRLALPLHLIQYIASLSRAHEKSGTNDVTSKVTPGTGATHCRQLYTPSLNPPITRHTLRELDLCEILKNPQLRHDVVFDPNVQFRPNFDGERGRRKREAGDKYWAAISREIEFNCTCTAFEGRTMLPCSCPPSGKADNRKAALPPVPVRAAGGSIRVPSRIPSLIQELRAICLSILPLGGAGEIPTTPLTPAHPLSANLSSRPQPGLSREASQQRAAQEPTAKADAPAMQKTCELPAAKQKGRNASDGSEPSSAQNRNATNAQSRSSTKLTLPGANLQGSSNTYISSQHTLILQMLDPQLITQELAHGVLDVSALITMLGSVLKLHCAPMRDEAIERMVATVVHRSDVGKGLRSCFEILELMKLDIANHQLRTARPYLVDTAVEFESRWFREQLELGKLSLDRSFSWFTTALQRAESQTFSQALTRTEAISKAFDDGFLNLIFEAPLVRPTSSVTSTSAIPLSASQQQGTGVALSSSSLNHAYISYFPEMFQFDAYRLITFHADATDITIMYMLLLLFRQLACSPLLAGASPPSTKLTAGQIASNAANLAARQIASVKEEIWCLLCEANTSISARETSAPRTPATPSARTAAMMLGGATGSAKLEDVKWRAAMGDVLLQVAARASAVQIAARDPQCLALASAASAGGETTTADPLPRVSLSAPPERVLAMLRAWLETNLRVGSPLHKLCQSRLRDVIAAMLADRLGAPRARRQPLMSPVQAVAGVRRKHPGDDAVCEAALPGEMSRGPSSKKARLEDGTRASIPGSLAAMSSTSVATDQPCEAELSMGTLASNTTARVSERDWESVLVKAGLETLSAEVKLLGDRITKVAVFHLRVMRPFYERFAAQAAGTQ
ncbi:hypothetical protein IE81DRAFT_344752 [Ceraceosorus guamensis]|uniref:Tcp11-domain-containing protein n=1 Tax=Ceraceosorus guamensis TaxID=1522189 RepID=A0A316W8L1_9BASI|nr:hypothetical protein IE81DRAFT_344752 [Ceraceosorus guamensis]PWN45448.1 hypothetical protein IE81DRAFT_344752 [Ceraceosorus guamensis]